LKKHLVPILWAIGGVASLIPAVVKPLAKGEPLNYTFLVMASMFFIFAGVFFAIGRKSAGGSGPRSA
jgi:hypothetical protein